MLIQFRQTGIITGLSGIQILVDALRQMCRIGGEDTTKITIHTITCALNHGLHKMEFSCPPSIILEDGTPVLEQAGSQVTIIIPDELSEESKVNIHSSVNSLSELVDSGPSQPIIGMLHLRSHGDLLLRHCGFDTGDAARAF